MVPRRVVYRIRPHGQGVFVHEHGSNKHALGSQWQHPQPAAAVQHLRLLASKTAPYLPRRAMVSGPWQPWNPRFDLDDLTIGDSLAHPPWYRQ